MLGLFKRLSKGVRFSNYYLLIIWRLLLAYIIYSLCRAVFLIYNLDLLLSIGIATSPQICYLLNSIDTCLSSAV